MMKKLCIFPKKVLYSRNSNFAQHKIDQKSTSCHAVNEIELTDRQKVAMLTEP